MKKVYGDIRAIWVFGLWSIILLYGYVDHTTSLWMCVVLCLVFLWSLFSYFFSFWSYNSKGFKIKFVRRYECNWSEVRQINSLTFSNFVVVVAKDNFPLILSPLSTRRYFKVLADVVKHVQKNNPYAYIPPKLIKQLEKPPKFYIF